MTLFAGGRYPVSSSGGKFNRDFCSKYTSSEVTSLLKFAFCRLWLSDLFTSIMLHINQQNILIYLPKLKQLSLRAWSSWYCFLVVFKIFTFLEFQTLPFLSKAAVQQQNRLFVGYIQCIRTYSDSILRYLVINKLKDSLNNFNRFWLEPTLNGIFLYKNYKIILLLNYNSYCFGFFTNEMSLRQSLELTY